MTPKKATEILQGQFDKLNTRKPDTMWQTQTSSYVKTFFGEDSPEYSHISTHNYWDDRYDYTRRGKEFINNCIETIQNRGLYKKPGNFITRIDDKKLQWLIGGTCTILLILATIIYNQGKKDGKNESIRATPEPVTVAPQKSNTDAGKVGEPNKEKPNGQNDSFK